jgi:hypothetical protein
VNFRDRIDVRWCYARQRRFDYSLHHNDCNGAVDTLESFELAAKYFRTNLLYQANLSNKNTPLFGFIFCPFLFLIHFLIPLLVLLSFSRSF